MMRIITAFLCCAFATSVHAARLSYPPATKGAVVDDYHGTNVADPYRWLETESRETSAWIDAERKLSSDYLTGLPGRESLRARVTTRPVGSRPGE